MDQIDYYLNKLTYQSLERNQLNSHNMTPLEKIYPEEPRKKDDFACMHCKAEYNLPDEKEEEPQLVLNRGIYSNYLEPEYYRYNKSIRMDIDDVGRKYMQYKPRRPKCPITFGKLFKEPPKAHLIKNPLYNYPISENIQHIEKNWQKDIFANDKDYVKSLADMMDEMDNAYVFQK